MMGKRKNIWGMKPPSSSYAMRVTVHSMFTCSASFLLSDWSSCFSTKSEEARSKEMNRISLLQETQISKSNSAWESYGKWVKNGHFNYQEWSIKKSNINFKHSNFCILLTKVGCFILVRGLTDNKEVTVWQLLYIFPHPIMRIQGLPTYLCLIWADTT